MSGGHAPGTCQMCGGATSRKAYTRCVHCLYPKAVYSQAVTSKVEGPRRLVALVSSAPTITEQPSVTLRRLLKSGPKTLEALSAEAKWSSWQTLEALTALRREGANIHDLGGAWSLERVPETGGATSEALVSDKDGWHRFGAMGDTHLCSKQERLDELHDMYRIYEANDIRTVFHQGNYIDGEAPFNKYELKVRGMDAQLAYMGEHYPQKPNIRTLMISGDDHEGWYCQREGVDIGRYMESVMQRGGRTDITHMGYMECFVPLEHVVSGKRVMLHMMHPGGGSAYATSYTVQKITECVPVEGSEALTPGGWKSRQQLSVGDSVLGFNPVSGQCEWTTITNLHDGVAPVQRYENDQFSTVCTANHRWAIETESRGGKNPNSQAPKNYRKRKPISFTIIPVSKNGRSRLIQAAPAPDGPGIATFTRDAALNRPGAEQTVLSMTSGERRAFIEGLLLGEGTVGDAKGYRTLIFAQNTGPVHDAFRLACFLEGIATTSRLAKTNGSFKPEGAPRQRRVVLLKKPWRAAERLRVDAVESSTPVWCPTTPLGSWVMRQGDTITITGNSYEGGEKPAILLAGHYHKAEHLETRNVHTFQTACFQDQTVFARKKKLTFTIGGWIVMCRQNPETGAIEEVVSYFKSYYNRGYYANNRWSLSGPVTQVPRLAV